MKRRKVISSLLEKGFDEVTKKGQDHRRFRYVSCDGMITHIRTYVSHGSGELTTHERHSMAKQLELTDDNFAQFIACPLTREAYNLLVTSEQA